MIRTIIWFTAMWSSMFFLIPAYVKSTALKKKGLQTEADAYVYDVAGRWAKRRVDLAGARVTVHKVEALPDAPFLIVANHQGNFDIPLIISSVTSKVGFLSKVENGKLPFIGAWMSLLHCVFIERGNPRQAMKAIQLGADILKQGYNLVLFPEGTRSKDGKLQDFKPGSLKLATKAGVPIVTVIIDGSFNMMKKSSLIIHPAEVKITLGKHFDPTKYESTAQLSSDLEQYFKEILNA